jgi:integrase
LPPDLAQDLAAWREISANTAPDALVFPSERGTYLSRDNFLRRNIQGKLEEIGLGWVNFQVLRRTQASLGHNEGVDPKVAADQRGHAIGVAIDTYTESDLESRREAITKLERALALDWQCPRCGHFTCGKVDICSKCGAWAPEDERLTRAALREQAAEPVRQA